MNLSKDLREFVALLNSTRVKYLLVGGHAVAWHGYPRFTGDIDFFVESSVENATRLERVLLDFGFQSVGVSAADFMTPGMVIQLGRPPNRIDLLTSIDGVEFGPAWENRAVADLEGMHVNVISKADLLRNKRATGRGQDLADIERLEH
jgi:hypothetical protein